MRSSISRGGRLALHYAEEDPDEVAVPTRLVVQAPAVMP